MLFPGFTVCCTVNYNSVGFICLAFGFRLQINGRLEVAASRLGAQEILVEMGGGCQEDIPKQFFQGANRVAAARNLR